MAQMNHTLSVANIMPNKTLPYWEDYPLSYKIPAGRHMFNYSINHLGEKKIREKTGDFDTTMAPRAILQYKPEADPNLRGYFSLASVRKHLRDQGLVEEDGSVPCSLRELNTYRSYLHKRNLQRIGRSKELEKQLTYGRKDSLFNDEQFTYDRTNTMSDLVDHLYVVRKNLATAELHLHDAQAEYYSTLTTGRLTEDKKNGLQDDIERRIDTVKQKRRVFDRFLTWLEGMEYTYQDQLQDKFEEKQEAIDKAKKRHRLRDYLQTLCREEDAFKSAAHTFEQMRRTDERMRMDQKEHERLMTDIYNMLVALRLQRKAHEKKVLLRLMQRMAFGGVKGSQTSLASLRTEDLDKVSLDSIDERELLQFMSSVISINCDPRGDAAAEERSDEKRQDRIFNMQQNERRMTTEDLDSYHDSEELWDKFVRSAAPSIIHGSAKAMAIRIANRRLTYNFEQPYTKVLYGKKRMKAPGVAKIGSELLARKRSSTISMSALSQLHANNRPQDQSRYGSNKANFFAQKAHTCDSYVELLQLRAKQIRHGFQKPQTFSLEHWNINDDSEKLNKIRQVARSKGSDNSESSSSDITPMTVSTGTHTARGPLDLSVVKGYLPVWARPPGGMGLPIIDSSSLVTSRLWEFDSNTSLSEKGKAYRAEHMAKRKEVKGPDSAIKKESKTEKPDSKSTQDMNEMTDSGHRLFFAQRSIRPPHHAGGVVPPHHKSRPGVLTTQGAPAPKEETGLETKSANILTKSANLLPRKSKLQDVDVLSEEIEKNRDAFEMVRNDTAPKEDAAANFDEFLRRLHHYLDTTQDNVTISQIELMKDLAKNGVTFSEMFQNMRHEDPNEKSKREVRVVRVKEDTDYVPPAFIRMKNQVQAEAKSEDKMEPKPEGKLLKAENKSDPKPEEMSEPKAEDKSDNSADPRLEDNQRTEALTEDNSKTENNPNPEDKE